MGRRRVTVKPMSWFRTYGTVEFPWLFVEHGSQVIENETAGDRLGGVLVQLGRGIPDPGKPLVRCLKDGTAS